MRNMLIAAVEERYRDAGKFQLLSLYPLFFCQVHLLLGAFYLFIYIVSYNPPPDFFLSGTLGVIS